MEEAMAKKEVIRTPALLDLGKFMKAPVSPAVRANGFIFTGGYVPLDPKSGKAVLGPIEDQARRTLDNLRQVLELAGSSLDKVRARQYLPVGRERLRGSEQSLRRVLPGQFPRAANDSLAPGWRLPV
jgi:Endoribonuclease L-PSP